MPRTVLPADAREAYDDFCIRSLCRISSSLERLIYIASTREYNSGLYHHDGLSARFGPAAASRALEYSHAETFQLVSLLPLRQLTAELEKYMASSREQPEAFLNAWQRLEPYRVAIPLRVDPTVADLFISNIKVALAIVRHRLPTEQDRPQDALPPPSPDPRSPLPSRN